MLLYLWRFCESNKSKLDQSAPKPTPKCARDLGIKFESKTESLRREECGEPRLNERHDTAALARTLDMIGVEAKPHMRKGDFVAKRQITSLVRHLTLRVLEAEPDTAPERVWA